MAVHRVGAYPFEFWGGQPPQLIGETITSHTKPGVNGVGQQRLGNAGQQFEAQLEAWVGGGTAQFNLFNAKRLVRRYQALRGAGLLHVVYNNLNYSQIFKIMYSVEDVVELDAQANVRLMGPNFNYQNGVKLIVLFRMTPHALV